MVSRFTTDVVESWLNPPCVERYFNHAAGSGGQNTSRGRMQPARKPFTIEKNPPADASMTDALSQRSVHAADEMSSAQGTKQVLAKLEELGAMIQPAQTIVTNIAEAYRREVVEALKLREEMQLIQDTISETKRHVVSLHTGNLRAVNVNHASGELGAVVMDTEGATNNILAAAERIEIMAGVIQSETTPEGMKKRAGEIAAMVMTIYEACNFQDLTGQRISRVCETLNFVESRVAKMADIWGGLDALSSIMTNELEALKEEHNALGTHALAAGPAMVGADGHVGQDDIDALFD
jgi:chemotaxis protein CheZ